MTLIWLLFLPLHIVRARVERLAHEREWTPERVADELAYIDAVAAIGHDRFEPPLSRTA